MSKSIILERTVQAFKLTADLMEKISSEKLELKIPDVRCNKLGEQFWCIIGARESYLNGIENGDWQGFSCSLQNKYSKDEILSKLEETTFHLSKLSSRIEDFNERELNLLIDLFTHEIQHHGQLIRFHYALNIPFPKSWNSKYTV